jgi:hypothetical protein
MKRETALLVLLYVLTIIGCVLSYHLGAEMEKLKMNSKLQDVDERIINWRPMSQMAPSPMKEWVDRLIPDGAISHTNQAPFDRRRRPILHVSDHIEKLIDEKE